MQRNSDKIDERQEKEKELVLEHLRKIPIVQVACERAHIGRTTYYRWCSESEEFEKAVEDAIAEADKLMNDMGESQLLTLMKDKHWPAIRYWLEKHSPRYLSRKNSADKSRGETKIIMLHPDED